MHPPLHLAEILMRGRFFFILLAVSSLRIPWADSLRTRKGLCFRHPNHHNGGCQIQEGENQSCSIWNRWQKIDGNVVPGVCKHHKQKAAACAVVYPTVN